MLRCSTFGCDEPPIKQSNKSSRLLLCKECTVTHFAKSIRDDNNCTFNEIKIKLSENDLKRLRNNIKKSISQIENQKNLIISEAIKIKCRIELMVRLALEKLDNTIKEYNEIYKMTEFNQKDYENIRIIIRKSLEYENPSFSVVKEILTKNRE